MGNKDEGREGLPMRDVSSFKNFLVKRMMPLAVLAPIVFLPHAYPELLEYDNGRAFFSGLKWVSLVAIAIHYFFTRTIVDGVSIDGKVLVVRKWRRTMRVPFSNIRDCARAEPRGIVTLTLEPPGSMGKTIRFFATEGFLPVEAELADATRKRV